MFWLYRLLNVLYLFRFVYLPNFAFVIDVYERTQTYRHAHTLSHTRFHFIRSKFRLLRELNNHIYRFGNRNRKILRRILFDRQSSGRHTQMFLFWIFFRCFHWFFSGLKFHAYIMTSWCVDFFSSPLRINENKRKIWMRRVREKCQTQGYSLQLSSYMKRCSRKAKE